MPGPASRITSRPHETVTGTYLPAARRLQEVDAPRRAGTGHPLVLTRRPQRPPEAAADGDGALGVHGVHRAVQIPLDVHLQFEVDEDVDSGWSFRAGRQGDAAAAVGRVEIELDPVGGDHWRRGRQRQSHGWRRRLSAAEQQNPSRRLRRALARERPLTTRRVVGDPARRDDGWRSSRGLGHPSLTRSAKVRMWPSGSVTANSRMP